MRKNETKFLDVILIVIISVIMYALGKGIFGNSRFVSLQLVLSILFTVILLITAFLCGKNNQKWFEIVLITPLIQIAGMLTFGVIALLFTDSIAFMVEVIFNILWYGFIVPFLPLSLFLARLFKINAVLICLSVYLSIIGVYFWGRGKWKINNVICDEEIPDSI